MLSLIAIAKNEAGGIAEFLNHHRPLFDEMIVVDTGSTDETISLAKAAGALVHSFEWCDDFSAARNFSLEKATGSWVLCLDIDEFIDPSDFNAIRRTLTQPPTCYMLPQWNYYDQPQHQEWQPVNGRYPDREKNHIGLFSADQYRLFPTGRNLQWQGRVHEDLSSSVGLAGLPKAKLDIPVHHYGYVKSDEHNAGRNELYGRLVRKKLEDDPEDWKANLELAYVLIQEGHGREAMPVLEKVATEGEPGPVLSRVQNMLATLYHADNRSDEAIALLHQAVTDAPDWLFGWTDLITILLTCEHWEQAEAGLTVAKESFGENPLLLKLECQLLIKTRRIVEAIAVARRIDGLMPGDDEYARLADQCEDLARRQGLI